MTQKNRIIFLVGLVILISVIAIVNGKSSDTKYFNMEFTGKVESVGYDIKGYPTLTIKGDNYFIGAFYNFDNKIETGDSMIKVKGQYIFKLIKKNSVDTLYFTQ
jgi:hypothetical protein